MKNNKLPEGWQQERVRRVIDFYENQSEDDAMAEDEMAYNQEAQCMMAIPDDLVETVRELVAKHQAHKKAS